MITMIIHVFETARNIIGTIALIGMIGIPISIAIAHIANKLKMLDKLEKDYEDDF